jgi:hypothetical protein
MNLFAKLTKVDAQRREVHGLLAEEEKDRSGEIFDYTSSKPYVLAWSQRMQQASGGKSYGNVRSQHGKTAAGLLTGISFDDLGKRIPIVARIVDKNEWEKVVQGVYTGFSIGGAYLRKWQDGNATRYTANPYEVSIVDLPCMPGATFSMVKADGGVEQRTFRTGGVTGKAVTGFDIGGVDRHDVAKALLVQARMNPLNRI